MSEDTDGGGDDDADDSPPRSAEEERLALAGRKGRRVGTVIMVVFGTWFVLTTVYNFAVDVFGNVFGLK